MNPAARGKIRNMESQTERTFIWDLPTRLFHWGLAVSVSVCLATGLSGSFSLMDIHIWSGIVTLGLLIFRLMWGFIGNRYARFHTFLVSPGKLLRGSMQLLQGRLPPAPGHNPPGGWMIMLMLLALFLQTGTGLFADDDIWFSGPLAPLLEYDTRRWVTGLHHDGYKVIIGLVSIHILAIFWHEICRRHPLVRPMFTGYSQVQGESSATPWLNAVAAAAITLGCIVWIIS